MSELIETTRSRDLRWQLLVTVSAVALVGAALTEEAFADDPDGPTVWITLGGQLEHITGTGDRFILPFMEKSPTPTPFIGAGSPIDGQRPARYSYGAEGALTFRPEHSEWVFSAAVRYGRSRSKRYVHQQTETKVAYPLPTIVTHYYPSYHYASKYGTKFTDNTTSQSESHFVLDFQAGHDFGIGMFGRDSKTTLSAGVRFAQFSSKASITQYARPEVSFYPVHIFYGLVTLPQRKFPTYTLRASAERSFHGIGPSLSWTGSTPIMGNTRAGELSLDWGISGALLFGRQKSHVRSDTLKREFGDKYPSTITGQQTHATHYRTIYHDIPPDQLRSRSVVVPNLGLKAALSYDVENVKVTVGYRADFFIGAVDAGTDERRTTDLTFHGPFASISLGIGG